QRHEEAPGVGQDGPRRPALVAARRALRRARRGRQGARRPPGDRSASARPHGADGVARVRQDRAGSRRRAAPGGRSHLRRRPRRRAGRHFRLARDLGLSRHRLGDLMSDLDVVLRVARKDLLQELRSRATTVATLFFSASTLVLMAFALGRDQSVLAQSAPGVLWVAIVLAGVIAAAQSLQADLEEGAFDQLLTYAVPRATIYLGKLLANWLYLSALSLVLAPVALTLYGASVTGIGAYLVLLAALLLGSLGFAVIATFYAALTSNLQAREALLPVLMFPVVVPILLAAVRATETVVGGAAASVSLPGQAAASSADLAMAGDWVLVLAG